MLQFYQRLKQSLNQRTLYALIALGLLLGFSVVARIDESAAQAETLRRQADERLVRHGGGVDEVVWRDRAANAEAALAEWRAAQWSGSTAGVVAAELQRALSQTAASAQLRIISITVEPAPVELPDGLVLRFRVAAESNSGGNVAKALAALSAHQPMIFIDGINVVFNERRTGRFSFSGYAPIAISAAPQESS